jgi:hypothetical protein
VPPPGGNMNPVGIPPELLPLIAAAAGATSVAGRQRMYPAPAQIDATVRQSTGGVPMPYPYVDAEFESIRNPTALPAPTARQAVAPDVRMLPQGGDVPALPPPARALPPPGQVPIDIPLGDIEKPRVRVPAGSRKMKGKRMRVPKTRVGL